VKDLSVVIVSWNTRKILRDCLLSVYRETAVPFEVIVVDNASEDGSVEMVRREFAGVRLIVNEKNAGFARANNQALAVAEGRYAVLLNSDTIVLDGALDKLIRFADAHPEAAAVGPRVLNSDMSLQRTCFMFPSILNLALASTHLYKIFGRNRFFGRERMGDWQRDSVREVDVVTGCCIIVRRRYMEQVGMLDEDYFMYGEETDWCYRFRQAGYKVLFTPEAQIIHLGGASSRRIAAAMSLQLKASILLFFKKHRGRVAYVTACMLVCCWFMLRIPFWAAGALLSSDARQRAATYARGAWNSLTGKGTYRGETADAA
jgi:GT2 family glycosyltransferase